MRASTDIEKGKTFVLVLANNEMWFISYGKEEVEICKNKKSLCIEI